MLRRLTPQSHTHGVIGLKQQRKTVIIVTGVASTNGKQTRRAFLTFIFNLYVTCESEKIATDVDCFTTERVLFADTNIVTLL